MISTVGSPPERPADVLPVAVALEARARLPPCESPLLPPAVAGGRTPAPGARGGRAAAGHGRERRPRAGEGQRQLVAPARPRPRARRAARRCADGRRRAAARCPRRPASGQATAQDGSADPVRAPLAPSASSSHVIRPRPWRGPPPGRGAPRRAAPGCPRRGSASRARRGSGQGLGQIAFEDRRRPHRPLASASRVRCAASPSPPIHTASGPGGRPGAPITGRRAKRWTRGRAPSAGSTLPGSCPRIRGGPVRRSEAARSGPAPVRAS